MAHDVFISHAHKDKSIADAICERLESDRIKCWIAARDISSADDRTEAARDAIGACRVMVLVLSQNANAAPHIEREIAHAFYTRRIIIPFRLSHTLPRRDFLFYLGDFPYFNALVRPGEADLEAFTAHIKSLVLCHAVNRNVPTAHNGIKAPAPLNLNSSIRALRTSHYRTLEILRRVATAASFFVVVWLFWIALPQTKQMSKVRSMYSGSSATSDLSPHASRNAFVPSPVYTFTRFGLWEPANSDPNQAVLQEAQAAPSVTPVAQSENATSSPRSDSGQKAVDGAEKLATQKAAGVRAIPEDRHETHRGKSRPKADHGRVSGTERLRPTGIKSRLKAFWRQIVTRNKETRSR